MDSKFVSSTTLAQESVKEIMSPWDSIKHMIFTMLSIIFGISMEYRESIYGVDQWEQ